MSEITYIPVGRLWSHPDNPRRDLGDLSELAESIRANGVLQNLTVVKNIGEITGKWTGSYTIVIGHRRAAAAKLAGLTELPCVIAEMTPAEQLSTMLLENMQRSDLTVFEQAQSFRQLLNMGETVETVARKTGFSTGTVRRRLKMGELDQKILQEVSGRPLSLGDFDKLAQIEDLAARNKCLEEIGTGNFNQSIATALKKQSVRKALPEAKACIKALKAKRLELSERWNESKYERYGECIHLYEWEQDKALLPKGDKRKIFYYLDEYWGELQFYVERRKAVPAKRSQAEIDREKAIAEARARADDLCEVAYRLRSDFVKGLSLNSRNMIQMLKGAVAASIFRCIDYDSGDRKLFCSTLGIEDGYNGRAERAAAAFAALDDVRWPLLIYADFGDSKDKSYVGGYKGVPPEHKKNPALDALYDWLCSLGYEMSDDEKAMREGTHELFCDKEAGK